MRKTVLLVMLITSMFCLSAQTAKPPKRTSGNKNPAEIRIPMEPSYWNYDTARVEFTMHRGVNAVKGKNGAPYQIFLKDHIFSNGTIEFDVELVGMGFPGINFRMSDDFRYGENFYIRSFGPVTPEMRTTLQYAAIIDGMSIWDLTDEYQAGANIYQEGWNHVKLVVSGRQMKVYVNDMLKPALHVPELEGRRDNGGISLSGNVIYSNLVIGLNTTDGLPAEAGYISTMHDTRFLRKWMVGEPRSFAFGKDLIFPLPSMRGSLTASDQPDSTERWEEVQAEPRGIVNLSRKFGAAKESDGRRLVWLKTTIRSDKPQDRTLALGFSDEVWVFVNGQIAYVDKNYFGTPGQKFPSGRCSIENASIKISLREGENEILLALANYFYGWGIIGRLDDTGGIHLMK